MNDTTNIKLGRKTHADLRRIKGTLQAKSDEEVTFDHVLAELISFYKKRHK